jgi:hypothetical protein
MNPAKVARELGEWIETGSPIISAAYDVAVGRAMIDLCEESLALKFLGNEGAMLEIEKSAKTGFLPRNQAGRLERAIRKVVERTEKGELADPWLAEGLYYKLLPVQKFLDRTHYLSFLKWAEKLGNRSRGR